MVWAYIIAVTVVGAVLGFFFQGQLTASHQDIKNPSIYEG